MRLTICIALQCCDEVCIIFVGFFVTFIAGLLGAHAAKPDVREESNRVNSTPACLRHMFVCVTFHWEVASLVFLRQVKFPAVISIAFCPDQLHSVITHKPWQSMLNSAVITEAIKLANRASLHRFQACGGGGWIADGDQSPNNCHALGRCSGACSSTQL